MITNVNEAVLYAMKINVTPVTMKNKQLKRHIIMNVKKMHIQNKKKNITITKEWQKHPTNQQVRLNCLSISYFHFFTFPARLNAFVFQLL